MCSSTRRNRRSRPTAEPKHHRRPTVTVTVHGSARGSVESMNAPRRPLDAPDLDADRAGRVVYEQLRELGMTDDEIANGAPVDVDPADVLAWLDGRAPCPLPH